MIFTHETCSKWKPQKGKKKKTKKKLHTPLNEPHNTSHCADINGLRK